MSKRELAPGVRCEYCGEDVCRLKERAHLSRAAYLLRALLTQGHVKLTTIEKRWLAADDKRLKGTP